MLRKDVELLTEQVSGLVRAWETAGYVVSLVKWMVGLASAVAVIFATIKGVGK